MKMVWILAFFFPSILNDREGLKGLESKRKERNDSSCQYLKETQSLVETGREENSGRRVELDRFESRLEKERKNRSRDANGIDPITSLLAYSKNIDFVSVLNRVASQRNRVLFTMMVELGETAL